MTFQGRPQTAALDLVMGFTGNTLERDGENRTDETLAAALGDPRARAYVLHEGKWLCQGREHGLGAAVTGFELSLVRPLVGAEDFILLGRTTDGAPRLAVRTAVLPPEETGLRAEPLRALAMGGALDADTEGQLGQAEHFLNWHAKTQFCGRCGTKTVPDAAGYRRRCNGCGEVHFPRTDPVSIMLIHDGRGRCVLGRSPRFPEKMWSCLAGFIEPGETLEAAVRRETLEEAGITVGRVDYFASQPWPFPGSLMIGCLALATSTEIDFDGVELEACRWFTRDEVAAMIEERHPDGLTAPKRFAIAHHLTQAFVDLDD